MPLHEYRRSPHNKDGRLLIKGIKMNDPFYCVAEANNEPRWKDNSCAMIAATFEDKQVFVDGPSCSKIVRQWAVVDWCKWEPNTKANTRPENYALVKNLFTQNTYWAYGRQPEDIERDGWYTFDQVIKILDKDPPALANCDKPWSKYESRIKGL